MINTNSIMTARYTHISSWNLFCALISAGVGLRSATKYKLVRTLIPFYNNFQWRDMKQINAKKKVLSHFYTKSWQHKAAVKA